MHISKGIRIVGTGLFIEKPEILIINDLHIGYEEALHKKGIFVPRFQIKEIIDRLKEIFKQVKPKIIIINGDLKHEFGRTPNQEWKEILLFFDFLKRYCKEIIVIQGNHDPIIKQVTERRNVKLVKDYSFDDVLIVHGDELIETKAKTIIIGHEHPAITLREQGKFEKFKCFLKGKWKRKDLIAVPSFNPLLEGTDMLKEQTLSPFLNNIKNFEVYIVNNNQAFNFGKIKNLQKENLS